MKVEDMFLEHKGFIRDLIRDHFKKDFMYFSKYIYKPSRVNIINTPNMFIKPFKHKISADIYALLDEEGMKTHNELRIAADYSNFYYYFKYLYDQCMYKIIKALGKIIARTKFSSRKNGYLTQENVQKYLEIAQAGDILLTRGNWNASNIGIPGFWKHMSMYLGTGKYLKKNYPKKYIKHLRESSHYIIEATGEGIQIVDFQSLVQKNDYLGVSRTTFPKEKIHRTIKNSFNYIGSQYDFIFNFYSDKKLVCSELVMKSYAKEFPDDYGIEIYLEHVGSGLVFPPNNFIKLLIDQHGKKKAYLKPVIFIDSKEKTGENFIATQKDFLNSGKRSRLSIGLQ